MAATVSFTGRYALVGVQAMTVVVDTSVFVSVCVRVMVVTPGSGR